MYKNILNNKICYEVKFISLSDVTSTANPFTEYSVCTLEESDRRGRLSKHSNISLSEILANEKWCTYV